MAEYIPGADFQAAIEKCELCQEEEAKFYCKDCQEEMCSGCKTVHLRSKASRSHNVVGSSLGKSIKKERKPIKCIAHPKEIVRMYCTNCDEAICVKCATSVKHKKHTFEEIETTLHRYQEEISQSMAETKQQIAELEKSLQDIDVNIKDYIKDSDKTINGINKQRNEINKIADGLVNKVQKRKEQDLQLAEKEKKDRQKILREKKEHLQKCEEKVNSMNNLTSIQHLIKQPKINVPSITCIKPLAFVSGNALNLHEMFGQLVDSSETKSKQQMPIQGKDQKKKSNSDNSADRASATTISTDVVSKINPGVNCFHVSAVNDSEACCGGNSDLVLVDIHGKVKRKIEPNESHWGVAVSSKKEVFVTELGDTNIKKYLTDGKCINISDTQQYQPLGLCFTSQDDLLVCLFKSGDSKVVRMTTTGHIKQTIQNDKQHQPLFTNPKYVTENINGDVVVVDGNYPTTIVVVNKEGEQRYRYPHSSPSSRTFNWCYCIACDNTGCILVSDYHNHKIHQLDINGRFIQFIFTEQHGIESPRGLSIDNKGQLWLSNKDGKEVIIFKYKS